MLQSLRHFVGLRIRASDGALGKVRDFLLDDQTWTIRHLFVEIGSRYRGRDVLVLPEYLEGVAAGGSKIRMKERTVLGRPSILYGFELGILSKGAITHDLD